MKRLVTLAAGLTIACSFLQFPVDAQSKQFSAPGTAQGEALPLTPISLPDLPEYTGQAKLTMAMGYPATGDIERSVTLTYETKGSADSIIAWYRNALGMYQWTIQNEDKDTVIAIQNRSGNLCNIYCDNQDEDSCSFHISYSFHKPND